MCLQHSKYNGFNTFHKVCPGTLFAPFWLHFGSLGAALETQNAQRMRKRDTPKKHRKMIPQKYRKVAKMISDMALVKLPFYIVGSIFKHFGPPRPWTPFWLPAEHKFLTCSTIVDVFVYACAANCFNIFLNILANLAPWWAQISAEHLQALQIH